MEINELVEKAHSNAVAKGFYGEDGNGERNTAELLMLVVSELGEALEADRKNKHCDKNYASVWLEWYDEHENNPKLFDAFKENIKDYFEDELSDAFIRLADMCGYLDIDIESHIKAKMAYNATREKLHGKRY